VDALIFDPKPLRIDIVGLRFDTETLGTDPEALSFDPETLRMGPGALRFDVETPGIAPETLSFDIFGQIFDCNALNESHLRINTGKQPKKIGVMRSITLSHA
jgi:hypothetical protein